MYWIMSFDGDGVYLSIVCHTYLPLRIISIILFFFSNTHYLYPTAVFLYFLRAFSLFIVFAIFLVPIKQKQKKSRISVPFTPFLSSGESRSCAYVDLPRHNVNSLVVANKRFWSLYKSLWRWMG